MWQAGPAGSTTSSRVSRSQSARTSTTRSTLPEVSPFFQSARRLRLQKWARPVSAVRASASAFAQATMSTSPLARSWTTTGSEPARVEDEASGIANAIGSAHGALSRPCAAPRSPAAAQLGLGLADADLAEVEDGRGERGARARPP